MKLLNAFSINMLKGDVAVNFIKNINPEAVLNAAAGIENFIGHKETDDVVRKTLSDMGCVVAEGKRESVVLLPGEKAVVAQYIGQRLPEGAKSLPEGSRIEFWFVELGY